MELKYQTIAGNTENDPVMIQPDTGSKTAHWGAGSLYAVVFILLCGIAGFLFYDRMVQDPPSVNSMVLPAVVFFLLGTLYALFLFAKLPFLNKLKMISGLGYSLLLFILIVVTLFFVSLLKGQRLIMPGLFYSTLFFLPYTIYQAWVLFQTILSFTNPWYIPEEMNNAPVATVFLNSIQFTIKVAPLPSAPEEQFSTIAPGRMNLGRVFYNFVMEEMQMHGNEIQLKDENGALFGWKFYSSSALGFNARILDANLNLNENGLKNNSTIIAMRATTTVRNLLAAATNQSLLN